MGEGTVCLRSNATRTRTESTVCSREGRLSQWLGRVGMQKQRLPPEMVVTISAENQPTERNCSGENGQEASLKCFVNEGRQWCVGNVAELQINASHPPCRRELSELLLHRKPSQ